MRFELVNPESISIRESQGLVKDIYDPVSHIREPLSEYQTMLELIHSDPTLATAYDIVVDFATYRGFDFTGGSITERDKLRNRFDILNYRQILPNSLYSLCYYGDSFLELRKQDSEEINELHPLETTEMRIDYDIHGKVEGYVQRPFKMGGLSDEDIKEKEGTKEEPNMAVFFEPEEVLHFRMKWIGSQVYSYNPNQPIATKAATSLYAGNYLMNIFINMPPRYVAHLAGISRTEHQKAKQEFISTKTNYKRTIAFTRSSDPQSKLQLQKVDPPYDTQLIEIMKYINNEVLKVTRVPRSWVEESGTENRGVTEAEQRPFDVRIQAIHRNMFEPVINLKLLPLLMGKESDDPENKPSDNLDRKKVSFRFNEISRKGEKEILENAKALKEMGLKPEALVAYLDERGILGMDEDDFQTPEEMAGAGTGMAKDKDGFPSRQRMNKSTEDMTQNRNEAGVSDAGGKKIAEATA